MSFYGMRRHDILMGNLVSQKNLTNDGIIIFCLGNRNNICSFKINDY